MALEDLGVCTSQGPVLIDLGDLRQVSIKVFSVIARLIYFKENINTSIHQFKLNGDPGVYFVEVSANGKREQFKLVKM